MDIHKKFDEEINTSVNKQEEIDALNKYSWGLSRIETNKSFEFAQKASVLSKDISYDYGLACSLRNKAQCYWLQGYFTKAINDLSIALHIFQRDSNRKEEAQVLNIFGGVSSKLEELDDAKGYYERALKIRREINDSIGVAQSLNSIGDTYMKQNQYEKALEIFKTILLSDFDDDAYRGIVNYNIAECYFELGKNSLAVNILIDCIELGEKLSFHLMVIYCSSLLGNIYLKELDYNKAISFFNKALEVSDREGIDERKYHILKDLSDTHEKLGDTPKAYQYFKMFHSVKERVMNTKSAEKLKNFEQKLALERLKEEKEKEAKRNIELEKAYQIIEKNLDKIAVQNKEITDSIRYAERIQKATLPSDDLMNKLLPESFVFYRPKDVLSGDFYWVSEAFTKYEESFVLAAVVDCTGHGVPGALMSIIGNNLLRLCEHESSVNRPSEALDFINKGVVNALRQDASNVKVKDGMDMTFIAIDLKNYKLHFAGAKNLLYIVREGNILVFKGDSHSIGMTFDGQLSGFTNNEIDLNQGDQVYMFTDGFVDQFGGDNEEIKSTGGRKYKYRRFRELLISISNKSPNDQKELIEKEFLAWKGDLEQVDDICIMGIKIN